MAGQTVDFNAIAKQFGGVSTPPANAPSGPIDYAALAKQHGATGYAAPTSGAEGLKSEGFLESAWKALTSPVHGAVEMLTPHSRAEKEAQIQKALNWADRFVAAHTNGTDAEKKAVNDEGLVALPFGSTVYKAKEGNYAGAAGDVAGLAGIGAVAKGAGKGIDAVKSVAHVVTDPAVVRAGVNVVPKGPAMVKLYDAVQNARGKGAPAEAPPSRAATLPPDVMAELTRESGPPEAPPEYQQPDGQPAPIPSPPAAWEGEAQLERLRADQASRAATGPVPVQQPRLLEAGPPVRQMEAPPDPSFVRAVPAQYPEVEQPATIAEQVKQQYAGSPAPPPGAPPEPQIGTAPNVDLSVSPEINNLQPAGIEKPPISARAVDAPAVDPQKSQFHANGERKSPQFRSAEKTAGNTSAKAQRWADALEKNGITPEIARKIQGGRVSDTQIQKGMAPRWENVLDDLVARGHLEAGETVPKSSLGEIIAELEKRETAKATAGAPKETAPQSQTKKNPRDMTRSELAKQAGLPENATPDQIMKALADAMEEDKPKAATAGKGK